VSAFGEAMNAVKDVLLMQANVERLDQAFKRLGEDVRDLGLVVADVDRRVARIEGVMEGYGRATASPSRRRALPKT
jgi:hypothetical protein